VNMSVDVNKAPSVPGTEETLLTLVQPLIAHWKQMFVTVMVAGGLGYAASYLVQPTFTSITTFLPPQQQQSTAASALASLGALAGLAGGGAAKSPAEQYVALMQSVTVADRMIDRFKLLDVYETKFRQDARKRLASSSEITVGKKDGLIHVSVEDHDPKRAAEMANQYVEELRYMTSKLAVSEAQQRRVFFEKQMQDAKSQLAAAQLTLQDSGFSLGALKTEPKSAAEEYARLRAELTAAEVKLQALRNSLSDTTPEVRQQNTVVGSLRAKLAEVERNEAPENKGADYVSRYREFKYQETLFELMAKQYEIARVDESREGALIQVVDAAKPAERRSKPSRAAFTAGAAALAFVIAASRLIFLSRRSPVRAAA